MYDKKVLSSPYSSYEAKVKIEDNSALASPSASKKIFVANC